MCDYSLMAVPNRLAREGEDLVAHRFPTGSLGLASPADLQRVANPAPEPKSFWAQVRDFFNPPRAEPVCAVCIPPGARLRLADIPQRLQQELGVAPVEEVVFTQITATVNAYRDAVRLQELREGQRVHVVDLSMAQELDLEALRLERAEYSFRR